MSFGPASVLLIKQTHSDPRAECGRLPEVMAHTQPMNMWRAISRQLCCTAAGPGIPHISQAAS